MAAMHHRSIPHLPNEQRQLRVPAQAAHSFGANAADYGEVRPTYPDPIVAAVCADQPQVAVDIGAGTGIFTSQLAERIAKVIAVEPDAALADVLAERGFTAMVAGGENTGLGAGCADLVSYAQAWHWVDSAAASLEAARILRVGGTLALVWNQFDVSRPWVHRLSRIMRSGDVHPVAVAPRVVGPFAAPTRTLTHFTQRLSTHQVLALARTRSSYLRASDAQQSKMQANLWWYLHEHLGFQPGASVWLPYRCVAWSYRRLGDDGSES